MSWPVASAVRNGEPRLLEALLDLDPLGVGIVGRLDLPTVRRRRAAGDVHRTPPCARPGVPAEHPGRAVVGLAADAVQAADDDRDPRRARQVVDAHQSGAGALDALALRVRADHQAGLVDEVDEWEVEQVAQLDQARRLRPGGDVGGPAEVPWVVGHDPDRMPLDPGETGDPRPSVTRRDLEERAVVDDQLDQPVGVVRAPWILGHEVEQLVRLVVDRVVRLVQRRQLVHARRQVRQEVADHLDRLWLGRRVVVDDAADDRVHLRPTELLLGDVEAERRLDHRRPAGEHLGALDHHVPVGQVGVQRADPRRCAEDRRHHRDGVHQQDLGIGEAVAVGQVGAADLLEAAHAAACRVEQADVRDAPLQGAL